MKLFFKKNKPPTWTQGKALTPNGVFEKVILCNLDRRPDRLDHATKQCEKVGIEFERISAVDGSDINWRSENKNFRNMKSWGALALSHTMLSILKNAIEEKWDSFLFMEDDITFANDFSENFKSNIKYVPDDWKIIHCGDDVPVKGSFVRGNIRKLGGHLYTTNFVAFRNTFFHQYYHNLLEHGHAIDEPKSLDICNTRSFYMFLPPLAFQMKSLKSDIK